MAYGNKIIDHFEHPRNIGTLDKNNPNVGTGLVGAPACGDVMKLMIQVDDDDKIIDAKFKTYGCGSAIASSSLLTEWVKGKTLAEASEIKNTEIVEELALPPVKIHCSVLAEDSIGGYVAFEDSDQNNALGIMHSKVLNEDDTGCFISSEDHEGNETSQDDNVLMKEMSDALLLEDSETETLNYVLSEEGGQMMLEDVFQTSEYKIVLDSNDSILIEDQPTGENYKLLNMDMGRFDIAVIANNTSLEIESTDSPTSSTDFFRRSDSAILVSRTEQITWRLNILE